MGKKIIHRLKKHRLPFEVYRATYANDDGFSVQVVNAPSYAKTKADVIALCTVKKNNKGKIIKSATDYYTPDEAMSVVNGLLSAIDYVMAAKFNEFRKEKDEEK